MTLVAQRDVKPVADVYLAVFVVQVEPVPECGLRLSPVSTTVVGITRTSSKRLVGEGLYWADTKPESPAMDLLRAHFRAEESFVNKAVRLYIGKWGGEYCKPRTLQLVTPHSRGWSLRADEDAETAPSGLNPKLVECALRIEQVQTKPV